MLVAAGPLLIVAWCEKAEPVLREALGGGSLVDREAGGLRKKTEREPNQTGTRSDNERGDKKRRDDK